MLLGFWLLMVDLVTKSGGQWFILIPVVAQIAAMVIGLMLAWRRGSVAPAVWAVVGSVLLTVALAPFIKVY
jgi:hypothetical protein